MKKTLQDQYLLIKEGKGHKGVFLAEAKRDFPHIVPNAATFEEAAASLKTKNIINENIVNLTPINYFEPTKKQPYELAFESFLAEAKKNKENEDEKVKAEEKKTSKKVEEDASHNFDRKDDKNPDNLIFDQIMMGYYAEMKDPKNADKTMQELKDIVFKNLQKDPIYYTKDGQFGVKGLGYTTEAPGLGTPKEAKGKWKGSGYGDLKESKQRINEAEQKLRRAIREIIDEEIEEVRGGGNYSIPTINTANLEKGERKAPSFYILSPEVRKQFNLLNPGPNAASYDESLKIPHIRITPNNDIFISDLLYVTLEGMEKGRGTREKQVQDNRNKLKVIANEIPDRNWPAIRALFKKFADPKPTTYPVLGKNTPYHEIKFQQNGYEVEKLSEWVNKKLAEIEMKLAKANSGEVQRGRPINIEGLMKFKKQLEALKANPEGGVVIVPPPFPMGESLYESVEKELAAINKEAEHEIIASKLEKVQALIDKKQSQLGKLDEDEDMKALTDSKKVKEIQKDIKSLEKAKAKLEKMMGKNKTKKKEVIDEIDAEEDIMDDGLDQNTIEGITEKYNEVLEEKGIVTDQDIQRIADQFPFAEKSSIMDYLVEYGSETEPNL
jgi:hypothetical protein